MEDASTASSQVTGHFDGGLRMWDVRSGKRIVEEAGLHDSKAGGICSVAAGSLGGECSYRLHLRSHLVSIMVNPMAGSATAGHWLAQRHTGD